MSLDLVKDARLLEDLSALADGEFDDAGALCAHWHRSERLRSAWHAYHLIGDVLRSEDLAAEPARDAAFLERLRARLAQEPVVLAPTPPGSRPAAAGSAVRVQGRVASAWSWRTASAVAAGFFAVAGVYTVMRPSAPIAPPDVPLASAPAAAVLPTADAPRVASADAAAPVPATLVLTGKLLRDAQLDAYLAAHEQFAGSSALGMPSAFLRSATVGAPGR
jgi:sigma-E factor negative regulatory protein RseA